MAYSLGFAHGRITLTYNGGPAAAQLRADLARIIALAGAAHSSIQRFGKQMDKMGDGLLTAAKFAGKAALGVTGLVHAIGAVAVVAQNLAPVLAAAFALLPGIILGGVVAMGVFKIATKGVGDALKAAGGDAKAFEEAIKGLSPQAQKFARAWRDAGKALAPIQKQMQDAFFKNTGPQVTKIAKAVGTLKAEAVGAAGGFNQVFLRVLEFGSSGTAINTIRSLLKGVREFLLNIDGAIKPLLTGFFNLARQAGEFGGALGNALAGPLVAFGNFLNNVKLEDVLSGAMDVLRPLGALLASLGSIISSVFTGLSVDGGVSLGVIGELVSKLAEFLKTAEGQAGLQAIGQAMSVIAGATGEVFLTLLKELTPVIIALAPGLGELALAIADVLVPAMELLGPVLVEVAKFASANMDWIAPLIIGIYGLAAAMKAYAAIARVVAAVQAVLNSALLASFIAWVRTTAATIAASAALVWHRIVTLASAAATAIASAATAIWGVITLIATSPITLIILAILILIGVIVLIATKTTWFQDAWKWAWTGIKAAAEAVWNWIKGTLWPGIRMVWDWLFNFIKQNVLGIIAIFNSIWGAIQSVIGFFQRLRDSVLGKLGELLSFIRSLPGMIGDALGSLGNLLWSKGKELVQGFINGIKSMFGSVRNTASNLIGMVTDFLPGSPAKDGPLSGKGWTPFRGKSLVGGLMTGMESQLTALQRVADQVASTAVPLLPTLGGEAGMGLSTIPVAPPAPVESHAEPIVIQSLTINVQGVLDMSDPQAARKIAVAVNEAIENVKREYR
jgi:hypothetical protein